jgi:hypothetical protein
MKSVKILSVVLILLLTSSCGRKEYTEEGIREIVKEIDSLLYNPPLTTKYDWGSAKAYSYFRAYSNESEELIFINEDYHYRSKATAFNRYYYKDGYVIYYLGKEYTGPSDKFFIELRLFIDPDGDVISYEKMQRGQRLSLSDEEAEQYVRHAQELAEIVEKRKVADKD